MVLLSKCPLSLCYIQLEELAVAAAVVHEGVWGQPIVLEVESDWAEVVDPGAIFVDDRDHLFVELQPLRRAIHERSLFVELIEGRIDVSRGIDSQSRRVLAVKEH